ncbi:hypothetical protein FUAX_40950 (plasmid) [Fulvitalea axinellae]|uniref:Phage head morphogenesis domain-containing protein n=1 Tax=Fulvitalea axinellae TaxID=1182444 RepID=A0AAU9D6L7_9BACT|nr:hypothetical protein FUAX_40950 [Fulvitalea axinellae]
MSKKVTKRTPKKNSVNIIDLSLSNVDRSYKGIKEWRRAIESATSVTNPIRRSLYDLYEEITLDLHLTAVLEKRRNKVVNQPIHFFSADGKESDEIKKLIETEAFEDMLKDILDSRFQGHSLLWFDAVADGKINYQLIDRRHVRPETGQVVKYIYDDKGIDYTRPPYSNYCLTAGKTKDLGLLSKAAVAVIYKKGDVADWALFAQIFGMPFREYIYDDPSTKAQLEQVAKEQESASYIVRPRNSEFNVHDTGSKTGSSGLYKDLAQFCDDQMSKLILLNTMTTDAQGGNYKGEVHAQSEQEVAEADKRFILRILNEKFRTVLANFGYAVEGGTFAYDDKVKMSPKEQLEFDIKFNQIAPLDEDYWYETYNRPKPKKKPETRKETEKDKPEEKNLNDTSGKLTLSAPETPNATALSPSSAPSPSQSSGLVTAPTVRLQPDTHTRQTGFLSEVLQTLRNIFRKTELNDQIETLYGHACHSRINLADTPVLFDTSQIIEDALADVYAEGKPENISPSLWKLTFDRLNEAVSEGLAQAGYDLADEAFEQALSDNNAVFSAFKAHQQQKELVALLRDQNGKLKSFSAFKRDTADIIGKYNKEWLRTEYNTAVSRARSAAQWKGFQARKKTNLRWTPSRSAFPEAVHKSFWNTVLPMDDAFWKNHFPGNRWNCKCDWEATDAETTERPKILKEHKPDKGLEGNPGQTLTLFTEKHPYVTNTKKKDRPAITKQAKDLQNNNNQ